MRGDPRLRRLRRRLVVSVVVVGAVLAGVTVALRLGGAFDTVATPPPHFRLGRLAEEGRLLERRRYERIPEPA